MVLFSPECFQQELPIFASQMQSTNYVPRRFNQELPSITLFYPVYTYAVGADVQGVRMGPLFDPSDRFGTITDWFLVTKRSLETDSTGELITPTVEEGPQG